MTLTIITVTLAFHVIATLLASRRTNSHTEYDYVPLVAKIQFSTSDDASYQTLSSLHTASLKRGLPVERVH